MTFRAQISVVFSFFLLLPFALVGCSGPSFVPLEGVLTLDGEAVEGATVCLTPKNREVGRDAAGTTDANGRFVVSTGSDPGCIVGEYSISVLKIEQSGDSIATMRAKNVFSGAIRRPGLLRLERRRSQKRGTVETRFNELTPAVGSRRENFRFFVDFPATMAIITI